MAPHSSTLAWKIPWMEEPGRLQSMGSLGVGHDWATSLSLFTFMPWRRKCNPRQCSFLESPRDGGAWWAAVSGVAQSGHDWIELAAAAAALAGRFFTTSTTWEASKKQLRPGIKEHSIEIVKFIDISCTHVSYMFQIDRNDSYSFTFWLKPKLKSCPPVNKAEISKCYTMEKRNPKA